MGPISPKTLVEALEPVCNVDVDAVDPAVATGLPFKPHNQTSNQVIMSNTIQGWEEVFNRVVSYGHAHIAENVSGTFPLQMVQFCANNLDNITNRVLVRVSPARIYSKDKVLEQCYAYDRAFKDVGIPRDRYGIKIAATGPGMAAAAILNQEGIRTLATSLFSLPQAVAASQSGCLYINPYLNEVAAYEDDSLMCHNSDSAMDHPMIVRLVHILEAYTQLYRETGKDHPQIVIASNASVAEIMATGKVGCQDITILAHYLEELKNTPFDAEALEKYPFLKNLRPKQRYPFYDVLETPNRLAAHSKNDPLAGPKWNAKLADIHVDYLANDGAPLTAAMAADAAVVRQMKDVCDAFNGRNDKAKGAIEAEIAKQRILKA